MTPERWRQISFLFHAALERDEPDRAAFLSAACAGDASLRQEIESLLRLDRDGALFMAGIPTEGSHQTDATSPETSHGPGFEPGALVDNRYRIVSLLGRGAMGEVYRSDDLQVGQRVALKFLSTQFAANATSQSRFTNEVRLARRVSHPNVCRVHDIGEANGRKFLSMEYIDGETLASLLHRIGRLSHEKVFEIARQVCAGLAAAHDQGVLHRDLKPGNIMIDGRGRARITDLVLPSLRRVELPGKLRAHRRIWRQSSSPALP
jgi:serine/threonine-protein kinase